jgi:hypothetical protein
MISPVSAPTNHLPTEIQMSAGPGTFISTYGMPIVAYTNETGMIVRSVTADTIASDGSWITFPTTPLLGQQNTAIPGPYIVAGYNIGLPGEVVGGITSGGDVDVIAVAPQLVGGAVFTVDPALPIPIPCPTSSTAGGASCAPCPLVDLTGNEDCNQPCPEVFIVGGEGGCYVTTSSEPLSFLEPKVPFNFKPDTSAASWSS